MMHLLNIRANGAPASYPTTGTSPSPQSSSGGFQIVADSARQAGSQGVSASVSSSLEAQTTSTLLQLQDLNQTQAHGGGGGGHHGGMKLASNLEAEEAAESEEAQLLRRPKKLGKTIAQNGVMETDEAEETADSDETDKPRQKSHSDSLA